MSDPITDPIMGQAVPHDSAAKQADGATGEKVVGAQARDRIARHQEYQTLADFPHAGWARRPHGDSVNGQFSFGGENRRSQIFFANA